MKKLWLVLLFITSFSLGLLAVKPVFALDNTPDYDRFAVVYGGVGIDTPEVLAKYDANKSGDLPAIFNYYQISRDRISSGGWVSGVVWRDGRVTVGMDKVVATQARTIIRWQPSEVKADMHYVPGSKSAYDGPTSYMGDDQTAWIKLNANGSFSFAVIKPCGNPVKATPVPVPPPQQPPQVVCNSLLIIDRKGRNEFTFKADATPSHGAQIIDYTFNFGDGHKQRTPRDTASHTYAKPGKYHVSVSVTARLGSKIVQVTGPKCQLDLTVKPQPVTPDYGCRALIATPIKNLENSYSFKVVSFAEGGAKLNHVNFDFGDGSSLNNVKPGNLGDVTHTYDKPGDYTIMATLFFNLKNGSVRQDSCKTSVSFTAEQGPVCPTNPDLPADSPECNLPSTGPAEMVAAGLGISSVTGAGYYYLQSKRELLSKLLRR